MSCCVGPVEAALVPGVLFHGVEDGGVGTGELYFLLQKQSEEF